MAREDAVIVNTLVRQALVSAQEVMGENGLNTVLRTSGLERYIGNFPPDKCLGQYVDGHGQGGKQRGLSDAQAEIVAQVDGKIGIEQAAPKHGQHFKRG